MGRLNLAWVRASRDAQKKKKRKITRANKSDRHLLLMLSKGIFCSGSIRVLVCPH